MLCYYLDGKHVKYAWNSWPRGWGGWEMECIFFLPAKRDHLLSASPLILIKEFLELRCFSKRVEGHILILFLRESWNDSVLFIFSLLHQSWEKARTKQKKTPLCLLPLPRAGDRVFCEHCLYFLAPRKATWSSAPVRNHGEQPILLLWSCHRSWKSRTSERRNHTGDSATSPCICTDESRENLALRAVSAFAFSAPLCTMACFWGGTERPRPSAFEQACL